MRTLMRLLPFVAVLIVGAGTMWLGLDLMTLPQKPAPRSASAPNKLVSAPNKLAQHEADQRAEKTEGDVSRPLAPLYPANPGGAKDVRTVYPPNAQPNNQPNNQSSVQAAAATETTGVAPVSEHEQKTSVVAAPVSAQKANVTAAADSTASAAEPQQAQAAEPQQVQAAPQQARASTPQPAQAVQLQQAQAVQPQQTQANAPRPAPAADPQQAHASALPPAPKLQAAKPEEPSGQKAAQDARVKAASNHCDVQACANAYASFRASDCTYQPFEGARRVCTAPPSQHSVQAARSERTGSSRLRQAGPWASQRTEALDDDAEIDAQSARGRRLIVIDRNDDDDGYEDRGFRPWR